MRILPSLILTLALAACASAPTPAPGPTAMVAAANRLAVDAGVQVLRAGGSAVDAAVAVQAVLGLVEPQSSGLGGGAFLVHYDAETQTVTAYDGRETAPATASPGMFLNEAGQPLPFREAVTSGHAVGAPGVMAMLALAHEDHGKLGWGALVADAASLAENGFPVSPRLAGFINGSAAQAKTPDATAYFTGPDGRRLQAGDTLRNPEYAETLRRLGSLGPMSFYEGINGLAILAKVTEDPRPGAMSMADLRDYRARSGEALCAPYRIYVVCTAQPPSSGVSLLQALKMLERTDIAERGPADPAAWLQLAEAERLMYADRDRYVADPEFVDVPAAGLLDPAYVASRAAMIGERAGPAPQAGTPPAVPPVGDDATQEPAGTSHFVIVDAAGDVVSMTTSVESIFGTGRMAAGYFLNNQLTDFSFSPVDAQGRPAANAVAPRKRPRSSMSPVIVLDREGEFVAALGSPGGTSILSYNLKALVGVLDWGLTMQQAIDLPNLVARGTSFSSEPGRFEPGVVEGLAERGVVFTRTTGEISGLHGVIARPNGLEGGADSRREGVAVGF